MNPEEPTVPAQPKLNDLASTLPLEQPEPLMAFLAERGMQRLADVRRAGGIGRIEGLPVAADHPAVRRLEALANLSAVSPDARVSTALIERGYDSPLAIARATRTEFVAAVRDQVGDFKAARMHVEARAQTMYLNNALTGILAARANGHSIVPYGDVQAIESIVQKCGCKDCEAVVGPLAYLADLLYYSVHHLKLTGSAQVSFSTPLRMSALPRLPGDGNGNGGNGNGKPKPPEPPVKPHIFPIGGEYNGSVSVKLSTPTPGAEIYYSLDGSDPNRSSTEYTIIEPIVMTADTTPITKTLKARAFLFYYDADGNEQWMPSMLAQALFTINPLQTVATPRIIPDGGTLPASASTPASIWLSTTTPGAEIHYTLDGTEPTPSSLKYTNTIKLKTPGIVTVKAKAFKSGMTDSERASTAFTVISTPANLPGRGLMGEYYNDTDLTDLKIVRTDATVNFDWDILSPDPLMAPDNFSVRWTGLIEPLYSEEYTFYAVSDDGIAVWIDGTKIIDAWWPQAPTEWSGKIFLAAGKKHSIIIEYFESYSDAVAMLMWSSDHQAKEIVPQSQLYPSVDLQFLADTFHQPFDKLPASCEAADEQIRQARLCIEVLRSYLARLAGLQAAYYDDINFSKLKMTRIDPTVDFEWGTGSPDASIAPDTFSVRWTGQIIPQFSDMYTFTTTSDDGVRLWIDRQLIIDNWTVHPPTDNSGTIALTAGKAYDLNLEFYEDQGGATIKLFWQRSSEGKSIVPASQLHPFSVAQSANLDKAEKDYLLAAYTSLFSRLGTSFTEIRLARSADAETRKALADRLGIDLGAARPDHLDELFLDPNAVPATLTESKLEEIFGLRDTRDPVTDTPSPSSLEKWQLDHLRTLWREQDWPTDPYSPDYQPQDEQLPIVDPDIISSNDFRVPIKKTDPEVRDNPFDIWLKRREWVDQRLQLFGTLTKERRGQIVPDLWTMLIIMGSGVTYDATMTSPWVTIPDLDKLSHDLTQATDEKTRKDAIGSVKKDLHLTVESFTRLMDLRDKDTSAENDSRYDGLTDEEWREVFSILTQATKAAFYGYWIQEEQEHLETQAPNVRLGPADFWFSLREPVEGDWPPLLVGSRPLIDPERVSDVYLTKVIPGKAALVLWQARRAQLDQMHKNLKAKREDPINGGFLAMLTLALGTPPSGNTDWDPILTQLHNDLNSGDVLRSNHAKTRIKNELHMTVGYFVRLIEVKANDAESDPNKKPSAQDYEEVYTILTSVQKLRTEYANWAGQESQLPLIDPEYVKTSDLAEPTAGKDALEQWYQRRAALDTDYQALKSNREQQGLDETLALALGLPPSALQELDQLYEKLLNETDVEGITLKITTGLYMTVEDFKRLMVVKIKSQDSKSAPPTEREWAEVYVILTSAQKMRVEYPNWLSEEQQLGLTPQNYWRVFKAALPRWRASAEALQQWKQALRTRSSAPNIDPDQVVPGDLKNPVKDDVAFDLWTKRNVWLNNADPNAGSPGLWQKLQAAQASGGLDAMIELETVKPASDLWKLDDERSKGNDIAPRLEQFSLGNPSFSYLLRIRSLIAVDQSILPAEWDAVYSILVQVSKHRKFAEWGEQERQAGLTLGPDYFGFPEEDKTVYPPPPPPWEPVAWRSTWEMRRDWQDTLQSRMDQKEAVKDALQAVVSATEEATLPMLRDALIMANDAQGTTLEEKAKQIADRLLIDTRVSGCQTTTRVAQAIETIQGLLWSLRTDQLKDTYPDLELAAPDFDEEWEWIGSYASWRAAMFVFMYPENILLPSLRKHQTPAFNDLVDELRNNRRLTPEQACQAVEAYTSYFEDVCSLQIPEVCVQASASFFSDGCSSGNERRSRDIRLFCGRGAKSAKAYWSYYDATDVPPYAQSFWDEVPELKDVQVLAGAVWYDILKVVLLFATVKQGSQYKLLLTKFHLDAGRWDDTPTELKIPKQDVAPTVKVIKKGTNASDINSLPVVNIWYSKDIGWSGRINLKCDDWDADLVQIALTEEHDYGLFKEVSIADLADVMRDQPTDPPGNPAPYDNRFFAVNRYVNQNEVKVNYGERCIGGYPTFTENSDTYGIIFATGKAVQWRDVLLSELRENGLRNPKDIVERIGSLNLYARGQGFIGAWPNFEVQGLENGDFKYGSFLVSSLAGELNYVPRKTLEEQLESGENLANVANRFKAVNKYASPNHASANEFLSAFPTLTDLIADPLDRAENIEVVLLKKSFLVDKQPLTYLSPCDTAVLQACGEARFAPSYNGPFDIPGKLAEYELSARKKYIKAAFDTNKGGRKSNLAYLEEFFYFVPMQIALSLQRCGQYMAALDWFRTIYDYSVPLDQRKIYSGPNEEEPGGVSDVLNLPSDWLLDPLNPHSIAEARPNTYTHYTLFSLIRCFLEYADAEFTRDTAESVPRARTLYLTALELLDTLQDAQQPEPCEARIRELDAQVYRVILSEAPQWLPVWFEIKRELTAIPDLDELKKVVDGTNANGVSDALGKRPWSSALSLAWQRIRDAESAPPATLTMAEVLHDKIRLLDKAYTVLMASPALAQASLAMGSVAGNRFLQSVSTASGISAATLESEKEDLPWLRNPLMNLADGQRARTAVATTASGTALSVNTAQVDIQPSFGYLPILTFQFCIPPNPVLKALKLHAELNLYKLRNCRNIAGMQRQLDAYAAPTDATSGLPTIGAGGQLILPGTTVLHPTPYRYKVLIERAKQLVAIAQQMEAAMLSALEKRDLEAYNLLKARQDVSMAGARVQLQNLQVTEAKDSTQLATLQRDSAQFQADNYEEWIQEYLTQYETEMIEWYTWLGVFQAAAAGAQGFLTGFQMPSDVLAFGYAGAYQAANAAKTAAEQLAILAQANINVLGIYASQERRRQEWEFRRELALKDVEIGNQQIKIAEDRERIAGQELVIAELQRDHAKAMVEFLSTKFTNVELYEWMSGVLENVFSFFLQQATSVAKLAENQLAFERQEIPPSNIQSDYWDAPNDEMGTGGNGSTPDRHGLTGSARLLQDIYQLDQYAFDNDKRKLQLSKIISLARMAPYEFQRFRETGVLPFATPIDLFDRDFPGHYLRLIKRVRTSVVALIPPTQGIHATLSNVSGVSRVVMGPEVFQTVVVRRDPESVALTAPINASGLFELEPQSEMLFPFEGLGVNTNWEFRMPKAANLFDYNTIADVLFTIEYTALDSFDYRQQVIQTLSSTTSGDRPFSFRQEFADAWYDLHNPDQATPPAMTVTFETRREDFPPNISDLKIQHVLLYFACTDGTVFDETVTLKFKAKGEGNAVGGDAKPNDGVISTRRGNAGSWLAMTDKKSPAGVWTLSLHDTQEIRKLFTDEVIEDILLVITYSGRTPEWPN